MSDGAPAQPRGFVEVPNKGIITVSVMLATIMQALDTTIANVALPHMQSALSASSDQIIWVLTSYLVAAAIATPLSGWLASRYGRKTVMAVSVASFTMASAAVELLLRQLAAELGECAPLAEGAPVLEALQGAGDPLAGRHQQAGDREAGDEHQEVPRHRHLRRDAA